MPALSRSYEHTASSYTCASNVFSIYDKNGATQNIPFTITEPSKYFYQDMKSILTEAGLLESFDDSRNVLKIFGLEYTIVVINCLDRQYCTAYNNKQTPTNGTTEAYATPIPVILRNGQTWVKREGYVSNTTTWDINISQPNTKQDIGGFGIGNKFGYRTNNATYYNAPGTYYHPIVNFYAGRVQWEGIRRTGKTYNETYKTATLADFSNMNFPLHTLATSIRYGANDYRYSLNCYYNDNYVYISFSLKSRNYTIPFCFMAKGIDKDGRNLHYFTADPSSATPLYAGGTGVTDWLSYNTAQQMYFSSYIPYLNSDRAFWDGGAQRVNNIRQKAFTLHNIISLDESEAQEINGHQIYKSINEHQTSPGLLFNTYDNFSSQNHVPRYTPHKTGETYKIPLKLRHGYGEWDNIYYTPDMTLGYNNFYEIDGETYYLVGHDYRIDKDYYYYNVLLKM